MTKKIYILTADDNYFIIDENYVYDIEYFKALKLKDKTKGTFKNPIYLQNITALHLSVVLNYMDNQNASASDVIAKACQHRAGMLEFKKTLRILNIEKELFNKVLKELDQPKTFLSKSGLDEFGHIKAKPNKK